MRIKNSKQNEIEYTELSRLVSKTLKNLPEKRRIIFELSRYKGLSNKQIASEMGVTLKTVEAHLTLALQSFRNTFKQAEIMGVSVLFACLPW